MLQLEETREGDVEIVSLRGHLDTPAMPQFKELMQRLTRQDNLKLLLDFGGVQYICSSAIATLITSSEHLRTRRGRMCLCGIQGQVSETFRILRLDRTGRIFEILKTREEALEALKKS